ncbi:hypothetical protein D3C77_756560 [compost metagenome]
MLQGPAVTQVGPVLGNDLQAQGAGGMAKLIEQKGTVLTVKHADALCLWQQVARQAQLAGQRRVAPQQGKEGGA